MKYLYTNHFITYIESITNNTSKELSILGYYRPTHNSKKHIICTKNMYEPDDKQMQYTRLFDQGLRLKLIVRDVKVPGGV